MRKLILSNNQSPGDIVMLTSVIRDLKLKYKGEFLIDVRSNNAIFENNPHISRVFDNEPNVETIDMHYPLIHESNKKPYHFIHGFRKYLEDQLNLEIPITEFKGDIHLSEQEKNTNIIDKKYWIIVAGGKYDFTAKWWNPEWYQKVVDHLKGTISFVQCGEEGHWHPPLNKVINMVGKTSTREFISLVYHSDGVLCPVTFAMHLAAAVPPKYSTPKNKPCVVIAGGREPAHWEAYTGHRFLSTNGCLSCCDVGGCWKSRCQKIGDGDEKDIKNVCVKPKKLSDKLYIPECMYMIKPEDVIRAIEMYYKGNILKYDLI